MSKKLQIRYLKVINESLLQRQLRIKKSSFTWDFVLLFGSLVKGSFSH